MPDPWFNDRTLPVISHLGSGLGMDEVVYQGYLEFVGRDIIEC